mgnify:CR=1 FL=1
MIPSTCPQNPNVPRESALCWANLDRECPACLVCPVGQTLTMARGGKRRLGTKRGNN